MSEFIQPYDCLMLAVLVGCIFLGVWKGMAWQLAALASVFLSAAVALKGCASLAPYFNVHDPWDRVLAMLVLYLVTAAAIWLLFRLVKRVLDRVELKEFDRQLGAIFGLLKGTVYCILITFFAVTLSESARHVVLTSRSGHFLARAIHKANPLLPEDVHRLLGKYIDELDAKLRPVPEGTERPADSPPPMSAPGRGSNRAEPPLTTYGAGGVGQSAPAGSKPLFDTILHGRQP
jgi:membrane protein required for colicin V production